MSLFEFFTSIVGQTGAGLLGFLDRAAIAAPDLASEAANLKNEFMQEVNPANLAGAIGKLPHQAAEILHARLKPQDKASDAI